MAEHRMQHETGPTWCKDCGRFDFACPGIDCPSPGSGDFDGETVRGANAIAGCLFEQFGEPARRRAGQEELFS